MRLASTVCFSECSSNLVTDIMDNKINVNTIGIYQGKAGI